MNDTNFNFVYSVDHRCFLEFVSVVDVVFGGFVYFVAIVGFLR